MRAKCCAFRQPEPRLRRRRLFRSFALAAAGLWYRRLPRAALAGANRVFSQPGRALREVHSGIVGDYLLWICVGTVVCSAASGRSRFDESPFAFTTVYLLAVGAERHEAASSG